MCFQNINIFVQCKAVMCIAWCVLCFLCLCIACGLKYIYNHMENGAHANWHCLLLRLYNNVQNNENCFALVVICEYIYLTFWNGWVLWFAESVDEKPQRNKNSHKARGKKHAKLPTRFVISELFYTLFLLWLFYMIC